MRARWTVLPGPRGGTELVDDATVVVRGTRIVDVLRGDPGFGRGQELVFAEGLLMPGFVNLHNHSINGPIFRGIVDDIEEQLGADELVYGLLLPLGDLATSVLSDDQVRAVYRLAVAELLRSGTTTVLEVPRAIHGEPFIEAARELGIRAFVAPYLFSRHVGGLDREGRPVYRAADEAAALEDVIRLFDAHDEGASGRIRLGFGPHATDTCSPGLLRKVADEARARDAVLTIHVAQSLLEVTEVRARTGLTPVAYLQQHDVLGPRTVAAHCVHAEVEDLRLLRDSGTTVANCPLTFARSGVAVPFSRFHEAGVRTGIGTDAYSFDLLAELRAAGFISKIHHQTPNVASADTLLHAATAVGGAALSDDGLGRIEPGAVADLIVLDAQRVHLQPIREPVKNLVWNATSSDVSSVMVHGELLLEEGRLVGVDEGQLIREATAAVEQLWLAAERRGILRTTSPRSYREE